MSTYPSYPPAYPQPSAQYTDTRNSPPHASRRALNRTPSPTTSEREALDDDGQNAIVKAIKNGDFKKLIPLAVVILILVLLAAFHDKIVKALTPAASHLHAMKFGYLIPIGILIVLSFPPLLGQEIMIGLVGLTWGVEIDCGIAAAGIILGELQTFFVFKGMCTGFIRKIEQKNVDMACSVRVVREGGWTVPLIARYSSFPSHMMTALFASCGMTLIAFLITAILSLPVQFSTVYLGYALGQKNVSKTQKYIQLGVLLVTVVVTVLAMRYISKQQKAVKPDVIHERRKRRQLQLQSLAHGSSMSLDSSRGLLFQPRPQGAYMPL